MDCHENEPDAPLPDYPAPSDDLAAYSDAQSDWTIRAAGVVRANTLKHKAVAQCLAALRSKGIIN